MIIDKKLMEYLSAQAKANPRLRQAIDLRTTPEDGSHRTSNAVEAGQYRHFPSNVIDIQT